MALRTPKVTLLCVGNNEDPCEGQGQRRLVRGDATLCKPLVSIMPPQYAPPWLIGIYAALRGKARADGEPASVTDEKPARDSTGRCGPVD